MDLYVLDDVSKGRGAFGPGPHQLHGLVKVPDVVGIHPQEGRMLQQNITQAWVLTPRFGVNGEVKSCTVHFQVKQMLSCGQVTDLTCVKHSTLLKKKLIHPVITDIGGIIMKLQPLKEFLTVVKWVSFVKMYQVL